MRKKALVLLSIIFFAHLFFRLYAYRENYFSTLNPHYWKERYNQSQWVVLNSKNPIGDDGLFTHAAWEYIHGASPLTIVPGYPPLGIYLLGTTILIFHNQYIFAPLVAVAVLIAFFFFNKIITGDNLLAFLPGVLFSFDPLFYQQLRAPYLDLIHLLFLILSMLFFLKKKYIASSFFLACFSLVKFPFLAAFVIGVCLMWLFMGNNYKQIKRYMLALPVIPITYVLFHFQYFLLGHSLMDFFAGQKWIVYYYSIGAKATPGIIYPMFFSGTWYTWWGDVLRVGEWTVIWPIIFLLSIVGITIIIFKGKKEKIMLQVLWIIAYLCFLSIIPVSPRYLLLLLPFLYNLAIWVLLRKINMRSLHF